LRSRRAARLGVAFAVAVLLLAGCFSGPSKGSGQAASGAGGIAAAAKKDGRLVWYTSIPQAVAKTVTDGFTAKYGIPVESVVLTSGLLATRFSSEQDSGKTEADVVTLADPVFFDDAVSKKWITNVSAADVPSLATWPKDDVHSNSYVLVNIQPIGLSYHTGKITPDKAGNWQVLLDPTYKGQVYLVNPANVPNWLALLRVLQQTYGDNYLKGLAGQAPKFVDSSVPGAQQVAAGAGAIVFPSLLSVSSPLKTQGAPIDTVFPSPTTGVEQYAAVTAKAPRPNAGRLFLDYLLSTEGQTLVNKGTGASPLGPLPGTVPLPAGYKTPEVKQALAEKTELLSLIGK
jgi:iron(III) transport system substrate-binding protein